MVFMFDIHVVRSLQKVKLKHRFCAAPKAVYLFLMIHKLGKNKRRSFSAATNLKTQPLEKQMQLPS